MQINNSVNLYNRAQKSIPGGVNSPVRAFGSVGGNPIFMKRAKGAYLYDADGNRYIDFIASWGPMILGHGHPEIIEAVKERIEEAISFGAPTEAEIEMAELVKSMAPNVDLVRMVNSGTEACMSAIRVARGYTGRNKFIKFEGCYHGHADSFLVKAGSGMATFGIQNVPGVTSGTASDTLTCAYNNLEAVQSLFEQNPEQIAAIIVEPVAGNMGCIVPQEGYLQGLRELCNKFGALLIFDEVMTGFRLAQGGAQQRLGVDADLITYGKVIGGGMPVGAFGGKAEIMQAVAPVGKVYQAGTLSGNPLAMAAGKAQLHHLQNHPEVYQSLDDKCEYLHKGLERVLAEGGHTFTINRLGSMISVHFAEHEIVDFDSASKADITKFNRFFHHMLAKGIYLPPSAYESYFLSDALSYADLDETIAAARSFQ